MANFQRDLYSYWNVLATDKSVGRRVKKSAETSVALSDHHDNLQEISLLTGMNVDSGCFRAARWSTALTTRLIEHLLCRISTKSIACFLLFYNVIYGTVKYVCMTIALKWFVINEIKRPTNQEIICQTQYHRYSSWFTLLTLSTHHETTTRLMGVNRTQIAFHPLTIYSWYQTDLTPSENCLATMQYELCSAHLLIVL